MAGALEALEEGLEEAFDRATRLLFHSRLRPIQIARAALRQMARSGEPRDVGTRAPNILSIGLNQRDFDSYAPWTDALQAQLASHLERRAQERGWLLAGPVSVTLRREASPRRGQIRVEASFPAAAAIEAETRVPDECNDESTGESSTPASLDSATISAWLVAPSAARYLIRAPATTIGRALANQIVLDDERVSRFHAKLRIEGQRFLLTDLGSLNGTLVAGQRVQSVALHEGASVSFGGLELMFTLQPPHGERPAVAYE